MKLLRYVLPFLLVYWIQIPLSAAEKPKKVLINGSWRYTSGDAELDEMRAQVQRISTDASTFKERAFLMKLWMCALNQQGADVREYLAIDRGLTSIVYWNTLFQGGRPQEFSETQMASLSATVDQGYQVLEKIQESLYDHPPRITTVPMGSIAGGPSVGEIPWAHYKGNIHRTGYTGASGPVSGKTLWKFPIGLAWESRPVAENGRVYVSSPGMRNTLLCLDLNTGEYVWKSRQLVEIMGDQHYNTACNSSTPVVLSDKILIREMGSRGNVGQTKHVVYIDKNDGHFIQEIVAGHVDYRAGYAPLDASEKYLVIPFGVQDIEDTPPISQAFNRIICKETKTGRQLWDFNIGPFFSEPLLVEDLIYTGTLFGDVFCLKAEGNYPPASAERIAWQFKADGAVNRRVAVDQDRVFFGSNSGTVYCLDRYTGKKIWEYRIDHPEPRSFRQFSTPTVASGKVYIGGSSRRLYCLDAATGSLLFAYQTGDWIRSRPVVKDDCVFFASMDGTLTCLPVDQSTITPRGDGKITPRWEIRLSEYPILADLTLAGDRLLVSDSDLIIHCVSLKGKKLWEKSIIGSFRLDGRRILTEQIAGGAYYQSKPTAVDGMVYVGSPARFIYALDAETGDEKWKFEMGAAISASPEMDNGKIYAGQQGGEDWFYCIDAKSGSPVWKQNIGWDWGSCNVSDGKVYIPGIDGYVNCLDANTGEIIWRYRTEKSTCSEPTLDGDQVYFSGWDHFLYAFEKNTGTLRWKFQLSGGGDSGVPVASDMKIYLPVGGNVFRCLDGRTGDVIWRYTQGRNVFNVTPAYHDGRVFLSCWQGTGLGGISVYSEMYCFDAKEGKLLWTFPYGGGLTGPVVGEGGKLYFASTTDPYFYCVDANGKGDGTTACYFRYRMGNRVEESTPALYRGRAYILCSDGYLHAIQ